MTTRFFDFYNNIFDDNDDIFTKFRKAAKYVYKNHELTQDDIINAIRLKMFNTDRFSKEEISQMEIIKQDHLSNIFDKLADKCTKGNLKNDWSVYQIKSDAFKKLYPDTPNLYAFISANNAFSNKYNDMFCYWKEIPNSLFFCVNQTLEVGYYLVYKQVQNYMPDPDNPKYRQLRYLYWLLNSATTKKQFEEYSLQSMNQDLEKNFNEYLEGLNDSIGLF